MIFSKKLALKVTSVLVLVCCVFMAAPVFAGNGDGSGGKSKSSLTLVSSDPSDGQTDVPFSTEIKLTFNKNVVNMNVKDENQKCFGLETTDGSTVPIEIKMADDQIEREKRNNIVIVPQEELKKGTTYIVKVSPNLQSKSGVTLGEELKLTFRTVGDTVTVKDKEEKQESTTSEATGDDKRGIGNSLLVALLVVIISYVIIRSRKNRK